MLFISFLLRNKCRPEESGVDMSTLVHPVAPPLLGWTNRWTESAQIELLLDQNC